MHAFKELVKNFQALALRTSKICIKILCQIRSELQDIADRYLSEVQKVTIKWRGLAKDIYTGRSTRI
jgi:hypothetical protein